MDDVMEDGNDRAPDDDAEATFLAFLREAGRAEGEELDDLLRRHPHLADELRALADDWEWLEGFGPESVRDAASSNASARSRRRGSSSPRYSLRSELGRGGTSVVFKVWDRELHRALAMKVCRVVRGPDDELAPGERRAYSRFVSEAQITAQLDHPGVVPIHDAGEDADGHSFFTMRMVSGRSLTEVIDLARERADGWSVTRLVGVLVSVCETLVFAHSRSVLHRDLKPSNVMVGRFGEVYVMDWGLAKVRDATNAAPIPRRDMQLAAAGIRTDRQREIEDTPQSELKTVQGAVIGTPAYMPPEQAEGRHAAIDELADVYSIGAILYHLLTGRAPYATETDEGTPDAILHALRSGPPMPVGRLDPDAPAELVSICEKAMARAPEQRYASAEELAADLRAYLDGRIVRAHRTGTWIAIEKWIGRNRALAVVSLVGTLGVVASLAMLTWVQTRRTAEVRDEQVRTAHLAEDLRFKNYVANIAAADLALAGHDTELAREYLAACPEDLRNWEWTHLDAQLDDSLMRFEGHDGWIYAVAVSPEPRDPTAATLASEARASSRRLVAAASADGDVTLWNLASGTLERRLEGHERQVVDVDFDPSGERLCTTSLDGTLRIWNVADGSHRVLLRHGYGFRCCAFSPDGRSVLAGAWDGKLAKWDAETGEELLSFDGHLSSAYSIDIDATHGRVLTASRDDTLRTWDLESGEELVRIQALRPGSDIQHEWSAAFSPSGARIAAGLHDDTIRIWDAETGAPLEVLRGHDRRVGRVAFLDEQRLVSGSWDRTVRIWDVETARELNVMRGHTGWLGALRAIPELGLVVSGCSGGSVCVFDVVTPSQGELSPELVDDVLAIVPTSDGDRIATLTRSGAADVWDLATCSKLASLPTSGKLPSAVWSADEQRLVVANEKGVVRVLDAASGRTIARAKIHDEVIWDLTRLGPDRFASTSLDGTLAIWDEGLEVLGVYEGEEDDDLYRVAADGRGRVATGSYGGVVTVRDVETWKVLWRERGHDDVVTGLSFGKHGVFLASGGREGRTILWNAADGTRRHVLDGHTNGVHDPSFSEDGTLLATPSRDGTVRVWNLARGESVLTLGGHADWVTECAFVGDTLLSCDGTGVRFWGNVPLADRLPALASAESARERVRPIVEALFASGLPRADVAKAVEADERLAPDVRLAGVRLARARIEDPRRLDELAWNVVRDHGQTPAEYARAVELAERACRFAPDDARVRSTLGVGRYRMGDLGQAIADLEHSRARNAGADAALDVRNLVFLAMAWDESGDRGLARALLDEARALAPTADAAPPAFLRVAERRLRASD